MNVIRSTDKFGEILTILTELGQRLPPLRDNPLFLASLPHYMSSAAYKFITVGPKTTDGGLENQTAFGFVTFYRAPMSNNGLVLAVEAFWFEDDNLDSQLPVWSYLAALARQMDFRGVCIAARSTNTPGSLEELVRRGELDGDPVLPDTVGIMPDVEGIYSAFADGPLSQEVLLTPCVRIFPQEFFGFFAGAPCAEDAVFYRGEGRLVNEPHWNCRSFEELAAMFMERGFPARGTGRFGGSVQEQILQQGYVNQPTVSLSKSFQIAATYATHNGDQEGVVFKIGGPALRKNGAVFDAYATMVSHCEPMFQERHLATLREVVKVLRPLKAGRFLERCNDEAMRNAIRNGGLRRSPEAIDWTAYVSEDDRRLLARAAITEEALAQLVHALESFWMMSVTPLGSSAALVVWEDGTVGEEPLRLGYYIAFRQVQRSLQAALEGHTEDYRQHGWDLTPFGYIAKTCRDEEAFSTGPVAGECIVEAVHVNRAGEVVEVLASR